MSINHNQNPANSCTSTKLGCIKRWCVNKVQWINYWIESQTIFEFVQFIVSPTTRVSFHGTLSSLMTKFFTWKLTLIDFRTQVRLVSCCWWSHQLSLTIVAWLSLNETNSCVFSRYFCFHDQLINFHLFPSHMYLYLGKCYLMWSITREFILREKLSYFDWIIIIGFLCIPPNNNFLLVFFFFFCNHFASACLPVYSTDVIFVYFQRHWRIYFKKTPADRVVLIQTLMLAALYFWPCQYSLYLS